MKTTLNPFENAKRTAQGTGGVPPAVIDEMQAEISILGSQNTQQAQDITDIKAQLTEIAGAYSATEHKTGRKWVDGKDIYEKTIIFENAVNISTSSSMGSIGVSSAGIDTIIKSFAINNDGTSTSITLAPRYLGETNLNAKALGYGSSFSATKIIFEYTKTGA